MEPGQEYKSYCVHAAKWISQITRKEAEPPSYFIHRVASIPANLEGISNR